MLATPTGLRFPDPLKITSAIESPRRCFADPSPNTHRIPSMMFDLPQPLGPTMPMRLLGNLIVVGSTNDLKPASLILLSRIGRARKLRGASREWPSPHNGRFAHRSVK